MKLTLRELLKLNKIPQQIVADALGISQSNIARYDNLSKRSLEEVVKISNATGLSIGQLLGDDFLFEISKDTVHNGRPYYSELELMLCDWNNGTLESHEDKSGYYINVPSFYNCACYILYKGNSMSPLINNGDIIALEHVEDTKFILWGEPYLIVSYATNELRAFINLVYPGEKNMLTLKSANQLYEGDILISRKEIDSMFLIKGRITRFQII